MHTVGPLLLQIPSHRLKTVQVTIEKNLHVSGSVLVKGQLYISCKGEWILLPLLIFSLSFYRIS